MSTLGSLTIRIVGDNSAFNKTIAQTQKQLNASTKGLQTVARSMTTVGDSMVKGITLPIIAIGVGLAKLGGDLDDAYDKIRTGTGATGKTLEGLKNDFREIAKVAPSSFKDIGIVVADLNTRLGLTGKPLQDLSIKMLNFARIAKTDINTLIPATTRVFGDWNISTDKQSKAMDFMFRATQATGIGIDSLAQKVVQFGAPLRAMGFDFETSITLLGKWEKEGVNIETVLAGLKIGLANFAREGVTDTNAALVELIEKIKNAGSVGEATGLAMEVFGSRAGPDMAAAIREGRFDLETLLETLKNGTDTINGASDATMDWKEKLILLRNNIGIALEPLAMKVFDAIGRAVEGVTPKIERLAKWFGNLSPEMQDNLIKWGLIAAVLPLVISGFGRVTTGIIKTRTAILTMNAAIKASPLYTGIAALGLTAGQLAAIAAAMGLTAKGLNNVTLSIIDNEKESKNWGQILTDIVGVLTLNPKYLNQSMMSIFGWTDATKEATKATEDQNIGIGVTNALTMINKNVTTEAKIAAQDHKNAIEALAAQYPELTDAELEEKLAMDEGTGAIEDQTDSVDDLRSAFNNLLEDIFGGITTYNDFQEAGWAVEEAQKALTEAEKELEKAQKATGGTFTANNEALQAYLSTNVEYLKNSAKANELQEKINKLIADGKGETSAYYSAVESLGKVQASLNEITAEGAKITGTYNSTGEQTEKQLVATEEATRNLEQAQNDLDDAMIANIETAFKLSTEIEATTEEQEEARKKAIELGLQYVATGDMSIEKFMEMAIKFGLSSADIIKYADEMGIVIDEATRARLVGITADASNVYTVVNEVNKVLNGLNGKRVTTYIDTIYNQKILSIPGAPTKPGGALGGIFTGKEFLRPMVSAATGTIIPKFDSGGVLALLHPPEIVLNAKEAMQLIWNMANRPIENKQGSGSGVVMHNTFNSPKPLSEAEINRNLDIVSRELGYRIGLN